MPSRTLTVVVSGDARGLNRTLGQVERQTRKTEGHLLTLGKSGGLVSRGLKEVGHGAAYALGAGGFGGGLYALFDITKKSISEFRESQTVSRQTAAALRSTGSAANVTAKQIQNLATAISRKSGIDDETIQTGENMLLTFTKIRNEAGRGNRIFDQTTQAVTDMAVAMGGGAVPSAEKLRTTSILVGKALNDPIRGSTALRRVGVALTKQQQDQIKTLEEHGHHLQAQKIILHELTNEFGGSAAKQRTAGKSLNVTLGNLAETIGGYLAPKITNASVRLNRFVQEMQDGRGEGGRFVRKMEDIGHALSGLARIFGTVGGAIASVVRWLARASANVSLFVEDVLHGTHQTGRFGAALHDVGVTLSNLGRGLYRIARGAVQAVIDSFNRLKDAVNKIIGPVKWLLDHIPRIHLPKLPFIGDPRAGWERSVARANAGTGGGVPGGTLRTAGALASKFGLHITSGYRSPEHNASVGGVEGSLHTHGSPSNPGAIDLVGPVKNMRAAEAWARSHLHLKELLVHDVGSGLHLHLGFGDPRGAEKAMARRNAVASSAGAFSFGELEALWVQAGGRRDAAAIMAHIAMAESGGIPTRNNGDRPGDGGRTVAAGLWQILGLPFRGNAYDPITNAKMAISKSGNGRNLHPWDSSRAVWGRFVGTGGTYTGSADSGATQAPSTYDRLSSHLDYIDLQVEAGVLSQQQGASQSRALINKTLPNLHGSARLHALAKRRQLPKPPKPPKPIRPKVDTTINNPWLQAYLDHQDNLQAAGQIDAITARENKAAALEGAIGHGLSGEDALRARGMVNDLRGQNYEEISGRTAPGQVDSVSDEGVRLSHIDAQVRAGDLTAEQGRQAKIASIQDALANWVLTDDARLELRGELKDLLDENTQAQADNTQALKDLQKSIDDQTNFAKSVAATEAGAMAQWVTEVISKQMGFGISGRGQTPGYGVARRS